MQKLGLSCKNGGRMPGLFNQAELSQKDSDRSVQAYLNTNSNGNLELSASLQGDRSGGD